LHDVHVNAERTIYFFSDQFGVSDTPVFGIEPAYSDAISISDLQVFGIGKATTDLQNFDDNAVLRFGKVATDSFGISDVHELVVDFNRDHDDSVALSENQVFTVSKASVDTFSLDDGPVFSVDRPLTDQSPITDDQAFDVARASDDAFSVLENVAIAASIPKADAFTLSEFIDPVMAFNRVHSDSHVLSENAVFASVKRLTDESTVLESQQFDVSKIRSDSFSLGEILAYGANLAKTDTLGVTEVLTVTRNPFAFEFTFGDGFTNVSGSPDDQFSFADDQTFGVSITLQDYFALDDFNQIDKHAGANKTNVYSLQDEHAVTFGKILDDSLNFSDPVAISFSNPL
jgi:hypothetical protein